MNAAAAVAATADGMPPPPARRRGPAAWLKGQLRNVAPFVTLIFLCVVFGLASPSFVTLDTLDNLANILRQVSVTAIIATGLTFVVTVPEAQGHRGTQIVLRKAHMKVANP